MSTIPRTKRLDLLDTYCFQFEAVILEVSRPGDGGCEVALDQTAFYVESGGQPADRGLLAGREVRALREDGGIVWHTLGDPGTEGDAPPEGLRAGLAVHGLIDAARRLDAMRQHTGQHILSQAFVRTGGRPTAGFHLGREESTIDLSGERPDPVLLRAASDHANGCVLSDRLVRMHNIERADLDKYPLRRDPAAERETLRLIEIEGYDWSACGGTHARRSGEVGPIQITGLEKVRSLWRVHFLAGERALSYWASAHEVLQEISRAHSVHWQDLPLAARAWKEEAARLGRELRRHLQAEAERLGEELFSETPEVGGVRFRTVWIDGSTAEGVKALAGRFVSLGPAAILAGTGAGERADWVAARSVELPPPWHTWNAGEILRARLAEAEGKGGGSACFAQGSTRFLPEEERGRLLGPLA